MNETAVHFAAGLLGGSASVFVGHPFDTLKVTQQVSKIKYDKRIWTPWRRLIRQKRVRVEIFKGMSFPLLTGGLLSSLFFGTYGNVRRQLEWIFSIEPDTEGDYACIALAGGFAGAVQGVPACPIELVKIKLQAQTAKSNYRSSVDCIKHIYASYGIRGCFHGLLPTVLRRVPGLSIFMTSYELLKQRFMETHREGGTFWPDIMVGGIAGVISWILIMPIDVVKSHIQADNPHSPKYSGVLNCAKSLYREQGARVFSRGLIVTCVRAFPVNAATIYVYAHSLRLMQQFTDE